MLVVIGHATYFDIVTPFSGIHYGILMKQGKRFSRLFMETRIK